MSLLSEKVAVVTGGGRGIGRAAALELAREGARVVVCDLGCAVDGSGVDAAVATAVVRDIVEAGGAAAASVEDVSQPAGAKAAIECAVEAFGGIDILVNCAGRRASGSLADLDVASWQGALATQAVGSLLCLRAAIPHMLERRAGRVVNVTGRAGLWGTHADSAAATVEAAVFGLTRAAAVELQRDGITVNAVAPLARTRLTESLPSVRDEPALSALQSAAAIVFLSSDLCQTFTGQIVSVAGPRLCLLDVAETRQASLAESGDVWTPQQIAEHLLGRAHP